MGPNVKKLICHKIAADVVPPGSGSNALGNVVDFLQSREAVSAKAKAATDWVAVAIAAVKAAPNNPYGDDDENIAAEILHQIEKRNLENRRRCAV